MSGKEGIACLWGTSQFRHRGKRGYRTSDEDERGPDGHRACGGLGWRRLERPHLSTLSLTPGHHKDMLATGQGDLDSTASLVSFPLQGKNKCSRVMGGLVGLGSEALRQSLSPPWFSDWCFLSVCLFPVLVETEVSFTEETERWRRKCQLCPVPFWTLHVLDSGLPSALFVRDREAHRPRMKRPSGQGPWSGSRGGGELGQEHSLETRKAVGWAWDWVS